MVNDDKMEIRTFIQNHEKQTHVRFKSRRVELGEVGELQWQLAKIKSLSFHPYKSPNLTAPSDSAWLT